MVCFQTKNPDLGKFWRVLEWKMLVYFMFIRDILHMVIWYFLWSFGIFQVICYFYGHLVFLWSFGNVVVIWFIFPRFGMFCEEKSGNPAIPNLVLWPVQFFAGISCSTIACTATPLFRISSN
jgi:hypothetical protein